MFVRYFSSLNLYLTVLLGLVAVLGDFIVSHSKIHIFQAIFDNATHAAIGGLSWFIICINHKEVSSFKIILETATCAFISSLIDVDHFIVAKSFNLKDATNLKQRPPLHCSTFPLMTCISLLMISYFLEWHMVKQYTLMVLTAFASHHTRDATRRGYWFYFYGSTLPLPYNIYIFLTCIIPYVICYLYRYLDVGITSYQKISDIIV